MSITTALAIALVIVLAFIISNALTDTAPTDLGVILGRISDEGRDE